MYKYTFLSMALYVIISLFLIITGGIYFFQEKVIFFPVRLDQNHQFNFDNEGSFHEINYKVSDDCNINALLFKAEESKGVVFYSHGNAGNLSNWGHISEIFLKYNYDLLIYDYRGYGKSTGKISEQALYRDANMIYDELLKSYEENDILVYGRSIGTGVAANVALQHKPRHLILESPYYNLPDLARKIFPLIPSFIIRYKFRNDLMVPEIKSPITIFHGTYDEVIYFGSSLKLERLLKEDDRIVPIVGGHHNDLVNFEAYHQELAKILQ